MAAVHVRACRWCRRGAENLCTASTYTGWDADGGYAEQVTVPAAFTYPSRTAFADPRRRRCCARASSATAPCGAPVPAGGRLGIYGFGASAHLTAQLALAQGAEVHVLTRGDGARGSRSSSARPRRGAYDPPPVPLDAAILFAPVGDLVPVALAALDAAGTLAVAGIHLSDVPALDYQRHLFRERTLTSVTANTRADGDELLRLAVTAGVRPHVTRYAFDDAPRALADLAAGTVTGAAVLDLG